MRHSLIIVLLALPFLIAPSACNKGPDGKSSPSGAAKAAPPVPVLAARVEARDMQARLRLVGRAEAHDSVTVRSRVDGQVIDLAFKDGQAVEEGAVLVRLDPADFEARLRRAEATLARDQALQARAQADLKRYISARTTVSEERLAEVKATADAAAANVRADEAEVALARLQLGYTTIRAPFAGRLGDRLVSPGALLKTNDTAIVQLNRLRPIDVSFSVPERHLPLLWAAGSPQVLITSPGSGDAVEGRVGAFDNAVDPATGTINLEATIPNEDERFTPGQFVNVSLTLETLPGALTVPDGAVQQSPSGPFVFVVKADQTIDQRPVKVRLVQEGIAVVTGVEAGETVVTDGQLRLTPGAKVQVKVEG